MSGGPLPPRSRAGRALVTGSARGIGAAIAAITTTIAPAHRLSPEQWQRDIDVNLTGAFRVVQACLRGVRERRYGRIVVISSGAATGGLSGQVAYAASKAGLLGLVKTLALEGERSRSGPPASTDPARRPADGRASIREGQGR